jgi:hypothetical protein
MSDTDSSIRRLSAYLARTSDAAIQSASGTLSDEATREAERTAAASTAAATAALAAHTGNHSNPHAVTAAQAGAEPALGNPASNGYVLISTTAGARSWVAQAGDVGAAIHAASAKTTPADADETALVDSAASYGLKKVTWSNIKATLKGYFDGLYAALTHKSRHATGGADAITPADIGAATSAHTHAYVSGVSGTAPIVSSGGTAPAISISAATTGAAGSMSAADKTKLNLYPAISGLAVGQVIRATGAATVAFGAVNLADTDGVTGILPVANGGTGYSVKPAFTVTRTTNQTGITSGTANKLLWNSEALDASATFDLANSRCTPGAGNWIFTVSVVYASMTPPANSSLNIYLYKNGSLFLTPVGQVMQNLANYWGVSNTIILTGTNGTDYYEIYVGQNTGSNQVVVGNSLFSTSWSGIML